VTTKCWRHDMFVYDDDAAFDNLVAPYLQEGLEEGEALMAVFVPEKQELLRDALGRTADQVDFSDAWDVYTRPEAVLGRYDATMRRILHDGAQSIRFVGELPVRETQGEWDTWMFYEGLLNHAFTHLPVRVVCTYDERVMPPSVLETSRLTHPNIHHGDWIGGEWEDSADFDPTGVVRTLTPAAEPLDELLDIAVGDDARGLRRRLVEAMTSADVPADQAANLLAAAGEAAANAQDHGNGLRALRAGRLDGHFVCELTDNGPGIDDPLVGHLPPRPGSHACSGLWVARQLTSRLEFLAASGGGMTTRLWS
jgi:anti-sigma regulatory factor (Ser/Thr protein kinase)